jgi:hypothetical protein
MMSFFVALWLAPPEAEAHSNYGDIVAYVEAESVDAAMKMVMGQHGVVYADTVLIGNLDTDRGVWRFEVWATGEFAAQV